MTDPLDPGPHYRPVTAEQERFEADYQELEAKITRIDRIKDRIDSNPFFASDRWREKFDQLDTLSHELGKELDRMEFEGP